MPTYNIVRVILSIILLSFLAAGVLFIFRSQIRRKRLCSILLAVLLFVIYILFTIVPIEEPFLTFPTVEKAFHYKYDYEIALTVEGNESTQVICNFGQNKGYYGAVLPKTEKGWKPEIQWDKKTVGKIFESNAIVLLQRYKTTDDFYLTIQSASGMDELYDNRNTEFQSLTGPSFLGKKVAPGYYYAYLDGVDGNYVLTIDGQEIKFDYVK